MSRRKSRGSRISLDRMAAAFIVLVIGFSGLLVIGYALSGRIGIGALLVALGALWLVAIAVLNSAARKRIDGVEPQAALITFGLALPFKPDDPLSMIFLLASVACIVFWSRRGFRL
jgi:hypothetical protein